MGKETKGGTYIDSHEDKNGKNHIDIYDNDPKEDHKESIHITIDDEGKGTITTKSGDDPRETTDTRCFLTTACMKHFKELFDDNCYELRVLRWFRDNYVYKEDIIHYYQIAPLIVEAINSDERNDIIYDYIYDNVVNTCVKAIENGNFDFAYDRYKSSILNLENVFVNNKKMLLTKNY